MQLISISWYCMVLNFTFKQGEKYKPCLFNVLMLSEQSSDGQIAKYNLQKLKGIDDSINAL